MSAPAVDDFLLRHTPGPTIPIGGPLLAARQHVRAAAEDLATIPDDALETPWPWRPHDEGETELRYGFYRIYELLEQAAGELDRAVIASGAVPGPAVAPISATTAARWNLHGLLAGIGDELLDSDPGRGEWTIRQTLAHIVHVQRAYGWFTAWWHSRRDASAEDFPATVPDEVAADIPDEADEAPGSMPDIQARLDAILDLSAGRLGGLGADDLTARARWSGYAVTVGFRLGRWASHMREHTVQVEKTLAMLGREATEVDRLVRLVVAAYGRLEERAFLLPEVATPAAEIAEHATRESRSVAAEVAALASVRPAASTVSS